MSEFVGAKRGWVAVGAAALLAVAASAAWADPGGQRVAGRAGEVSPEVRDAARRVRGAALAPAPGTRPASQLAQKLGELRATLREIANPRTPDSDATVARLRAEMGELRTLVDDYERWERSRRGTPRTAPLLRDRLGGVATAVDAIAAQPAGQARRDEAETLLMKLDARTRATEPSGPTFHYRTTSEASP